MLDDVTVFAYNVSFQKKISLFPHSCSFPHHSHPVVVIVVCRLHDGPKPTVQLPFHIPEPPAGHFQTVRDRRTNGNVVCGISTLNPSNGEGQSLPLACSRSATAVLVGFARVLVDFPGGSYELTSSLAPLFH